MKRINPYKLFYGLFIPNWLANRTELKGTTKLVYGRLIQFAGEQGVAYPSIETLAKEIGISSRMCKKHIQSLKTNQLIAVERSGLGKTNRYHFLNHPWIQEAFSRDGTNGTSRSEEKFHSEGKKNSSLRGTKVPIQGKEKFPSEGNKSALPIVIKSKKYNQEKENHRNKDNVAQVRQVSHDSVQSVFNYWKETMNHSGAKLDDKRKKLIKKAFKIGYDVEALKQAILGCSYTPHNIGINDRGQRYDGLHVILRDADQIDRFISNYHQPPKLQTKAEQQTQENLQSSQAWLDRKLKELDMEETR